VYLGTLIYREEVKNKKEFSSYEGQRVQLKKEKKVIC
jgi:hypothetical protein